MLVIEISIIGKMPNTPPQYSNYHPKLSWSIKVILHNTVANILPIFTNKETPQKAGFRILNVT